MSTDRAEATGTGQLILALGVCAMASQIAFRIADPVVPLVAADLSVSIAAAAALATAYALPYGMIQPILGPLGDAFGKANQIRIAIFVLAASLLLCAVAANYSMLVLARIASGAAAGGIIPAALAIVGDRVPLADRQVTLARMMTMNYIGMLAGPAMSGMVGSAVGWRMVFVLGACIVGIAAVFAFFRVPSRQGVVREPFSLATVRGHYGHVFANPVVPPFFVLVALEGLGGFAVPPYVASILAQRGGAGTFEAGIVLAGFGVGGIVFTFLARRIVPLLGLRRQMQVGGVGAGLALLGFALSRSWQIDVALFFFVGFGFLMLHITLQTFATELTSESRGSALALFALVFFIGQASGPLAFGALRPVLGDSLTVIAAATILAGVALVASYWMAPPRNADPATSGMG